MRNDAVLELEELGIICVGRTYKLLLLLKDVPYRDKQFSCLENGCTSRFIENVLRGLPLPND
jgi:hypothetical protein